MSFQTCVALQKSHTTQCLDPNKYKEMQSSTYVKLRIFFLSYSYFQLLQWGEKTDYDQQCT